jgi:zinc transport system substrate-binding protein
VASFYPLQYVAERVVGDHGQVQSLTKPGAEPHDLELTPQDVAAVAEADLVFYVNGFQSSVDDAVTQEAGDRALDVSEQADLSRTIVSAHDHDHGHDGEEGHDDHDGEEGHDDHDEAKTDPHFWVDPVRLAAVSDAFAEKVAAVDPDNAEDYRANAAALRSDLESLDSRYEEGLSTCASRTIVTSHTAFGYLADRYNLTQMGIAGLSPETEPTAAKLAEITEFVKENGVSTIYYETLVSPKIAETVAAETGANVAVLDPIEGLAEDSQGDNYLEIADANLTSLRTGLQCS